MSGREPRLYLVDGSSYLYRAFFALPPLSAPDGTPTNAVFGFATMLLKLLADTNAEYLGVVFDAPGPTFRDDLFAEYKANRPAMPEDLVAQISLIDEFVAAMRVQALAEPGVEADDVLATLGRRFAADGIDCVLVTGDKDLMQLVGPRLRLWDTMRDRWTDENGVYERLGVSASQVVDIMGLTGDKVDNIPGVRGIGPKTAAVLIRAFGTLDALLARVDEVEKMELRGAKKVARLLRAGAKTARLSRDLARLRDDVALDCALDDFRVHAPDMERLAPLLRRLGFHSLLERLTESAPALSVQVDVVRDRAALGPCLELARRSGCLALTVLAPPGPAVTTIPEEIVVCAGDGAPLCLPLTDAEVRRVLRDALSSPTFEVVGHGLKRDRLGLAAAGVDLPSVGFDTMIASYLIDVNASHGLTDVAAGLLAARVEGFRETVDGTAAGVRLLPQLRIRCRDRLEELELTALFREVEMPLVRILADMERRGVLLDTARLADVGREVDTALAGLLGEIHTLAGTEFNVNSPPQLREILFDRLGLPTRGVRRGKTGYSTDVDVLTHLAAQHPLPARILQYRGLAKLKSTYLDALPAAVNPLTDRLHTTFNQTVAATGRLSSSEPNLQNIPIRGEHGRHIREAFVAAPGCVLVAADYSQIELRMLAHLSDDPALCAAFREDADVHLRTATEIFGALPGTVTPEMRRAAKVINFGIIYGMGPQRLARELAISRAEATRYIESYFVRYHGVRTYMNRVLDQARESGYVATILGRRRPVPELRGGRRGAVQAAERMATNTPVQGSAADLIKAAMVAVDVRLRAEGLRAGAILQVHDELLIEVDEADRRTVVDVVRAEMEGVMSLSVPLRVDVGWGHNWAEAH